MSYMATGLCSGASGYTGDGDTGAKLPGPGQGRNPQCRGLGSRMKRAVVKVEDVVFFGRHMKDAQFGGCDEAESGLVKI
ncbi:hypothetical protein BM221_007437 [Beauveria bassiana]|uniref:Uncharacterized protein n=1 Tax=Beauveria bassiana TaxID=176275 RepID=A0A2N6NGP2_BEABA|nr:hypothetical protein BM221_007437 [Beauveria bassiana]